jgi:DNA-binding NarL/FixJ family response regulator
LRTVVIDDSDDLRELLTVALERAGRFAVVGEAADASSGIDVATETQPDLVLLDLGMPVVGGLDVLPLLRDAAPGAAVVVMSGYPRDDVEARVLGSGAAAFVEKGMSLKAFTDRVVAAAGVLQLVTNVLDERRAELDQDLRSGARARRLVTEALERWQCEQALDTVQLLVSELVTNAVVHANSRPAVAVILLPEVVRIEVMDQSSARPEARDASDQDESGRGLLLLDEMASRWGVEPAATGKTVWFEVPRFDA